MADPVAIKKTDKNLSPPPTEEERPHPLDDMAKADEAEIIRLTEHPSLETQTQEMLCLLVVD